MGRARAGNDNFYFYHLWPDPGTGQLVKGSSFDRPLSCDFQTRVLLKSFQEKLKIVWPYVNRESRLQPGSRPVSGLPEWRHFKDSLRRRVSGFFLFGQYQIIIPA